jgi:hypothetical protein
MTPVCDKARSAADPRARVKHFALVRDAAQIYQLGCGNAAHRVEVLEQPEICRRETAEVLSSGDKGLLNTASRKARRVLGTDLGDRHGSFSYCQTKRMFRDNVFN